jgi:hypothetical protein
MTRAQYRAPHRDELTCGPIAGLGCVYLAAGCDMTPNLHRIAVKYIAGVIANGSCTSTVTELSGCHAQGKSSPLPTHGAT